MPSDFYQRNVNNMQTGAQLSGVVKNPQISDTGMNIVLRTPLKQSDLSVGNRYIVAQKPYTTE